MNWVGNFYQPVFCMANPECAYGYNGCTNDVMWIYSGTGEGVCDNCKEIIVSNLFDKA